MPGLGANGFLHIAREVTAWGTAETSDFWNLALRGEDIAFDIEPIQNESISGGAARSAAAQGGKFVRGTLTANLTYNLADHLLWGVFGTFTESTPTGGTTTRDHWNELTLGLLPSFTIEKNPGDIEANDKVAIYTGMCVNRVEITIPDRGIGQVVAEFLGKDETSVAGGSTASALHANGNQAEQLVYAHNLQAGYDLGPAPDGPGVYCIKSFALTVNRNLDFRYCQGDQNTKQPIATEYPTIEGSFGVEFDDRNIYESFRAFTTETTGLLDYQGATIEAALKYGLKIKLLSYRFLAPSLPFLTTRGVLVANCPFVADFGNSGTAATTSPDSDSTLMPLAIRTRNINVKSTL